MIDAPPISVERSFQGAGPLPPSLPRHELSQETVKLHHAATRVIKGPLAESKSPSSERWYQIVWRKICEAVHWLIEAIARFVRHLFGIESPKGAENPGIQVETEKAQQDASSKIVIPEKVLAPEVNPSTVTDELPAATVQGAGEILLPIPSSQKREEIHFGGIPNIGNSCYMNSCLQSILGSHLRSLIEVDLPKPSRPEMKPGEAKDDYSKRLNRYLGSIRDWSRACKVQKSLKEFKKAYEMLGEPKARLSELEKTAKMLRQEIFESKICPAFEMAGLFKQHDAPECMLVLLTAIGISYQLTTKTASSDNPGVSSSETEISRILAVELGKETASFQKLLEAYSAKEIVDDPGNLWVKDQVKYSKYTREHKISGELPESIVIQLKRMEWSKLLKQRVKLGTKVTWDSDVVDLACLIDPELYKDGQSTKYTLVAYVNHHGSTPKFGHYTANVLDETTWIKLNDSSDPELKLKHEEKGDRESAYLFVLKRVC